MLSDPSFILFLTAALILAVTPGPGIFYVLTRSIKGGRREGLISSLGTATGGLVHVLAAALGLSAILMTSTFAFAVLKYVGAAYLIYLGVRILLVPAEDVGRGVDIASGQQAYWQGIVTEIFNPKTALFFLAFIPQFVTPSESVVTQFIILGCISIGLNTAVDALVALSAGSLGQLFSRNPRFRRGQSLFSGLSLISLGALVVVTGKNRQ